MYLFRQFGDLGREGNMETREMAPFFHLLFLIWLFVILIFEFENAQNSFSCGPTFGPFWSVKYLNFWLKTTDSESSLHFSFFVHLPEPNIHFLCSTSWTTAPHFVYNFPANLIIWLPLLLEILGNTCIVIIYYPVCDVINFEISLTLFFPTWPQKSGQILKYSRTKRAFNMKLKEHFSSFLKSFQWCR